MNFAGALFALERGHKVKRKHWSGYWQAGLKTVQDGDKVGSIQTIYMHTWDGKIVDIRDTTDIFYTLKNMACDEWEIVEDWDKETTQPDYLKDNAAREEKK